MNGQCSASWLRWVCGIYPHHLVFRNHRYYGNLRSSKETQIYVLAPYFLVFHEHKRYYFLFRSLKCTVVMMRVLEAKDAVEAFQ